MKTDVYYYRLKTFDIGFSAIAVSYLVPPHPGPLPHGGERE
jgi:hypothetical protein